MKKIDNFYYNNYNNFFFIDKDFPKRYRKYFQEGGRVEVKVYMNILGSLDDELKIIIPSIHNSNFSDNFEGAMEGTDAGWVTASGMGVKIKIHKIVKRTRKILKNSFILMFKNIENKTINTKNIKTNFGAPWVLTIKQQRETKKIK